MSTNCILCQRFICIVAIILSVGCSLAKSNPSHASNNTNSASNPNNTGNPNSTNNSQQTTQPSSPKRQTWQLNRTYQSTDVLMQIDWVEPEVTPRLMITVDAVNSIDASQTKNKSAHKIPEHYLTITSTCTENQTVLKTSTLSTYPLGESGTFMLQLPALETNCFNAQGIANIEVTLQLVLPEASKDVELRGNVMLEGMISLEELNLRDNRLQ